MATNSKREQIILHIEERLKALDWVNGTTRRLLYKNSHMDQIPNTMFPLVAVHAGMPVPVDVKRGRVCQYISNLKVRLYVYMANADSEDTDTLVSDYMDDVFRLMSADIKQGGLAINTVPSPEAFTTGSGPYATTVMTFIVRYQHENGI